MQLKLELNVKSLR